MKNRPESDVPRCSTGISGLDDILKGGLIPHRLYLIDGDPGADKTTLGLLIDYNANYTSVQNCSRKTLA